ncbi:hypothetical protein BDZ45DRAFT_162776 [Acephala macrosclerotiorum]|nr:hypothetical protein BDZ45DRAFT_162776 [Acephala macrosclerotiorum]
MHSVILGYVSTTPLTRHPHPRMALLPRLPFLQVPMLLIKTGVYIGRKAECLLSFKTRQYGYGPSSPVQSAALSDFEPSVAASSEKTQPQHAQVKLIAFNSCQQCHERFQNKTKLDDHAKETQHRTYACICGEPFSRFDCLNRHLDKFNPRVLHPCLYCSKYSGSNAFHRRDHLIQHLRNFHHHSNPDETHDQQVPFPLKRVARKSITACPHDGCAYHSQASTTSFFGNSQQLVFRTQKEFTRHLREVHDESPFPCPELGCNRVGGKGYFRRRDLLKHQVEHASTSQVGSPVQSDQFMFP